MDRVSRLSALGESQQCSQLKRQNAKLKKILRELTEIDSEVLVAGESVRSQRELQALGLANQESHSTDIYLVYYTTKIKQARLSKDNTDQHYSKYLADQ